ncbi:unnamed protein product, partial [marine sediment metagenome]
QIANNLAVKFQKYNEFFRKTNLRLLGTQGISINNAENRKKFSALLDHLAILQPIWNSLEEKDEVLKFAEKIGYPVLVRPSFVLSGAAMRVAHDPQTLRHVLDIASKVSKDNPVVITKFFTDSREIECDGVSDGETVFIGAIIEHIENAGIHSGDATMAIPPQTISNDIIDNLISISKKIALALKIRGPFNIQYLLKEGKLYVIECNLRSSRSMPLVSKTRGINLMKIAAEVILGKKIDPKIMNIPTGNFVTIKCPQFS